MSDEEPPGAGPQVGIPTPTPEQQTVTLRFDHDRNRELLAEWLEGDYRIQAATDAIPAAADLCLVDGPAFAADREVVLDWKRREHPRFAPVVLVVEETRAEEVEAALGQGETGAVHDVGPVVDEVVPIPVETAVLERRLSNLLERRRLSREVTTAYERAEERFAALFHATPEPAVVLDDDLRMEMVNDAFCEGFECEREAVVGRGFGAVVGMPAASLASLEEVAESGPSDEAVQMSGVSYRSPDGGERIADVSARALSVGDTGGLSLVLRDVTERNRKRAALERSERKFRNTFETTNDALVLADDEGNYLNVNPAAADLYERSQAELLGRNVAEFAPDEYEVEAAWERFLEEGELEGEFPLVLPDGEERILHFSATKDVVPGRHLSALRDITERVEHERELERTNDRLEQFASIVSHDLRNPLQVVKSRLSLLTREVDSDHLAPIEENVDRMVDLIDDLLTIAREGQPVDSPADVDLGVAVTSAWATIDAPEATLETAAFDGCVVRADESRLAQLLENLFRNAVDHAGESVTITVGRLEDGFYVADDGPGIPPDEREMIFDLGYSTAEVGTGLGLSIVREVAQAHGWDVRATESDAGGARFEVTGLSC